MEFISWSRTASFLAWMILSWLSSGLMRRPFAAPQPLPGTGRILPLPDFPEPKVSPPHSPHSLPICQGKPSPVSCHLPELTLIRQPIRPNSICWLPSRRSYDKLYFRLITGALRNFPTVPPCPTQARPYFFHVYQGSTSLANRKRLFDIAGRHLVVAVQVSAQFPPLDSLSTKLSRVIGRPPQLAVLLFVFGIFFRLQLRCSLLQVPHPRPACNSR